MEANPLNFNIYNSLILAGIIQGFVFGIVVLSSKKYRARTTLILAALILSFSFDNFQYYLEDSGCITETQLWTIAFIPFQLLSAPLFLLYGLHLIDPDRRKRRFEGLLFVPFVLALLMSSIYKIAYALDYANGAFDAFFDDMEMTLELCSIAFDMGVLIYLFLRIRRLPKDKHDADNRLRWFQLVIVSLFGLSLVWLYVTILDYFYYTELWYIIYIGMAITVYWMGHVGIYKFGVEQERKKIRHFANGQPIPYEPEKQKNEHIAALEKLLVDQKRFLDATLTLDKIAEELSISKSHLSRIINAELRMGFPDYLNSLRVEEAKAYLNNPDFAHYTLLAIGLEAGFNSKTTFNTAFKKATTLTPSEYRKSTAC